MKYCYEIGFSFDLGKMVAPVGELMERLNSHLANDGYTEKLVVRSTPLVCTITSDHEIEELEQETMKKILLGEICAQFPKYDIRVSAFRRKSGNVQQSVSSVA